MGPVSIYLRELVAKQVREYGIVVWYDPEKHYGKFVKDLAIPDATVARYCGSFFELRREVEPLIGGLQRPRLIVYVPMEQADAHHALAELEVAGAVLRPGQQPPSRNTRLSVVARNALKPVVHEEVTGSIEKQVEANKLDLDDLDRLADEGAGIAKGVISVIFGTGNPAEIALAFFTNEARDAHIEEKASARTRPTIPRRLRQWNELRRIDRRPAGAIRSLPPCYGFIDQPERPGSVQADFSQDSIGGHERRL